MEEKQFQREQVAVKFRGYRKKIKRQNLKMSEAPERNESDCNRGSNALRERAVG